MAFTFQTQARHGYAVKFSPFFAQRLACATSQHYGIAGGGRLFVLDVDPQHGIVPLRAFDWSNGLFDVAWSEDNENVVVTASGDGSIQVWDTFQPKGPLKVLQGHTKEVYCVDWSQTRTEHFLLSASWDKTIKMWDIAQDQPLNTFLGHDSLVYSALWSPHIPGCFATASGDHTLRLWDVRKGPSSQLVIPAHKAEILTCDWGKYDQNLIFSGSVDTLIRGWDIRRTNVCLHELHGHQLGVRRVKTSPHVGAVLASCSYDLTVRLWDLNLPKPTETVEHHSEFVYGLDFNLHITGQIADCSWDELIRVYTFPDLGSGPSLR